MTIVYGLIGLGVIVFIHELGHFIAARICGVAVESFSIGMGPVLLHKTIKNTDYRLSLIPLGGYCGMKGQKDFQTAIDEEESRINASPDSFYGVSPLKRAFIAFMGPFFNVLFASVAFCIISLIGYSIYTTGNKIIIADEIYPEISSSAKVAGLMTGDKIIGINGKNIDNFYDITTIVSTHPNEILKITVERNGTPFSYDVSTSMDKSTGAGKIGVVSWVEPVIAEIVKDSAAEKCGFMAGDKITKFNNIDVEYSASISVILSKLKSERENTAEEKISIPVEIIRNNEKSTIDLSVDFAADKTLGIIYQYNTVDYKGKSFFPSIAEGWKQTGQMFALTIKSIGLLFKGVDLKQAVSGPLRVTVMLGETAKSGFKDSFKTGVIEILNFLALISISLFLMNLLPIPILDGGIILFSFIELIIKKPIPPKVQYYVQFIGIAFILGLFALALFGDVSYIINLWRK